MLEWLFWEKQESRDARIPVRDAMDYWDGGHRSGELAVNRPDSSRPPDAQQLLATPFEALDKIIRYGEDPGHFAELRVPDGPGPFPVAVLVHGGCFRDLPSASWIGPMGDALQREGAASWSIESRCLRQPGA